MYSILPLSFVLIKFVVAIADPNILKYGEVTKTVNAVANKNNLSPPKWRQHFWKPHKKVHRNVTYIDKAENMIRLPAMSRLADKKDKKKLTKKSPKRTIQKIIKKNRQKTKKIYVIKMTSPPVSPDDFDIGQDELAQWKDDSTTIPTYQKKKPRKYNYSKIARYPMPFQRMQKMRTHKRDRRNALKKENLFIFKNFNELKFLHDDKDYSVVNTHVKNYW